MAHGGMRIQSYSLRRPSLSHSLTLRSLERYGPAGQSDDLNLGQPFLMGPQDTQHAVSKPPNTELNHGDVFLPRGRAAACSETARGQLIAFQLRLHSFLTSTIPQGHIFSSCIFQRKGRERKREKRESSGGQEIAFYLCYNLNYHFQNVPLKAIKSPFPILAFGCKVKG